MKKAAIKYVASYLPNQVVLNREVEEKIIGYNAVVDKNGILRRLFGSETRRFASANTQVSDLACEAAQKILNVHDPDDIDLLIFAAASSDLIEPATANIIQTKLGLTCAVFDIKNACNSFVNAMQVASAFVESGTYNNILIVCGEKLSEVTNYHPGNYQHWVKSLAGYTLGDAGAAMLIGNDSRGRIVYQNFISYGKHWNLCTVKGGGSLAYRDPDSYYFECDSKELQYIFNEVSPDFVFNALNEAGWAVSDIDWVISHQIASNTTSRISKYMGLAESKFINTFSKYGNIAAATIPLALSEAIEHNSVKRGDKLLFLGFAAGISLSVQLIEW